MIGIAGSCAAEGVEPARELCAGHTVELLLMTALHDLVRQGRSHELGPLLAAVFGPEDGPVVEQQFRDWMEKEPPLLR